MSKKSTSEALVLLGNISLLNEDIISFLNYHLIPERLLHG